MSAVLATLAVLPTASASKECRASFYEGSNAALLTGRYQDVAKDNAVISWGFRVTTSVGPAFAIWAHAEEKSYSCVLQGTRHKCTAKARPCRQ
jgi:hypothetical protein